MSFLVSVMLLLLWVTIAVNLSPPPYARTGILDKNPIHEDMVAAAEMAKLAFICNVVIDEDKKTVAAFAGNFKTAHRKGVDFLSGYCAVKPAPADIVITTNGGYPLDQNAYQCPKGMSAAEATVNDGGVIIMLATCQDGHGGESYYHSIADAESADAFFGSAYIHLRLRHFQTSGVHRSGVVSSANTKFSLLQIKLRNS